MLEFDETIQEKIDDLRTISNNWSEPLEVYQLLKVSWPEPDGTIYYCATNVEAIEDDLPVSPVELRLPTESRPDYFLPVTSDSSMGDSEIDLKLWDGDDEISRLVQDYGEGVKVEVLWWFPAVELLLSEWQGHLRTSQESDVEFWIGKAANGFRSPNLPMPRRPHVPSCQAVFGDADCGYDGSITDPLTGLPYVSCPKKTFAQCIARRGDKLNHLSHQSVSDSIINGQTKGPNLLATSRGNETNLKRPVRVVLGWRYLRDLDLMAAIPLYNNNHPDQGFWRVKFELCEGPIEGVFGAWVNGQFCQSGANAIHYVERNGAVRQPPTSFTPDVHNYSGTAHFDYTYGWVNPASVAADSLKGEGWVHGLLDVKEFTDEDSFSLTTSRNRAWQIFRMLTDKRWGYGADEAQLSIPSWIECGIWGNTLVDFMEPETGDVLRHVRALSDVELNERTTQQQIEDMCWAGRFSRPFLFQNKIHIIPLRALTFLELEAAPVFCDSDALGTPNIIWENGKTTVRRSQISDEELPNRIELVFDEGLKLHKETTISVEDEALQLRAGALQGNTAKRVVTKKEAALGVDEMNQAIKLAWTLLDLGKFNEGGLRNNLEVKFKAWFLDCLNLHPFKVIKVLSSKIERYGFEWFQIKKINRLPNLQVEIVAQAYNREYMDALEDEVEDPAPEFVPGTIAETIPLQFGEVSYESGYLEVEIVAGV